MRSRWEHLDRAPQEVGALFIRGTSPLGTYAGFVDAYYLKAEGARSIGKKATDKGVDLNAQYVVDWLRGLSQTQLHGARFLRAYWYDGAFDQSDDRYEKRHNTHEAIAHHVQLRLGRLVEYPSRLDEPIHNALRSTAKSLGTPEDRLLTEFDKYWTFKPEIHQKGVDTLITLDMVRLAGRSAFNAAVVISGDRDLAEVIRTVQDYGVRVVIVTPNPRSVAREVAQLADDVIELSKEDIEKMLIYP